MSQESAPSAAAPHAPNATQGDPAAPPDPAGPNRAPDVMREYGNDRITIQWFAERCIHSANCVRSLPKVFDPKRRPWIDPSAADADAIEKAIRSCPTGALGYVRNDGSPQEAADVPVTVTAVRNGPLYARGDLEVRDVNGEVIRRGTRMALCCCGLAGKMPFCDNRCRR